MRISCGTKVLPSLLIFLSRDKACLLSSPKLVQTFLQQTRVKTPISYQVALSLTGLYSTTACLPLAWFKTLCLVCQLETLFKRLASPISLSKKLIWSSQSVQTILKVHQSVQNCPLSEKWSVLSRDIILVLREIF